MTPLAPLVTAFFRQYLAVEKGVSNTPSPVIATPSNSCVAMSVVASGSLRPNWPLRISTHPWHGTS